MTINIGINEKDRKALTQGLSALLADTYTLYLKTHKYHWNVEGPMFVTLHTLFEQFYTEQWTAVDLIAERIRALGEFSPGSGAEFNKLSTIKEGATKVNATAMIKDLLDGQEAVVRTGRKLLAIADKANDQPTVDLVTNRLEVHEKNAWMLRSLLSK